MLNIFVNVNRQLPYKLVTPTHIDRFLLLRGFSQPMPLTLTLTSPSGSVVQCFVEVMPQLVFCKGKDTGDRLPCSTPFCIVKITQAISRKLACILITYTILYTRRCGNTRMRTLDHVFNLSPALSSFVLLRKVCVHCAARCVAAACSCLVDIFDSIEI